MKVLLVVLALMLPSSAEAAGFKEFAKNFWEIFSGAFRLAFTSEKAGVVQSSMIGVPQTAPAPPPAAKLPTVDPDTLAVPVPDPYDTLSTGPTP